MNIVLFSLFVFFSSLFCHTASPGLIDPFEIFIVHPKNGSMGQLIHKKISLLNFPYNDDLAITNLVNTARKQNVFLNFVENNFYAFDPVSQQGLAPQSEVQISSEKIKDTWLAINYSDIEISGANFFSYACLSYRIGTIKRKFELFDSEVVDHLASIIQQAKREKTAIMINRNVLNNRKKQQFMRNENVAYLQAQ